MKSVRNIKETSILVLGKRGGILQWYENILDADISKDYIRLTGFALNHNNWKERLIKKLLKLFKGHPEQFTASQLDKKIQQIRPDIILIADVFYFQPVILATLIKYKPACTMYHWIGDFFDERLIKSKEVVDRFLFTDSTFIDDAMQMGISNSVYFPLAFNPRIFTPGTSLDNRKNELLFVGAWSESRQRLLEQVEFPVAVYGKGWDKLKSDYIHTHPYNIPLSQVAVLYRQYSHVLNIINKANTRIGLNMRCFEVPASGAILVTEYSEDLKRCFNTEQDIIYFSSYTELSEKLHRGNSNVIDAQATCHMVHHTHTYADRLRTLVSWKP